MDCNYAAVAFLVACGIQVVPAWEYCNNTGIDDVTSNPEFCTAGCCGSESFQFCCMDDRNTLTLALIGGVVGEFLIIYLIIAVICICVKHTCRRRPAYVVQKETTAAGNTQQAHSYIQQNEKDPPAHIAPGQAGNPAFPPMQQLYPPVQPVPGQAGDPAFRPPYPERNAYGHPLTAPPSYPGQPQNAP